MLKKYFLLTSMFVCAPCHADALDKLQEFFGKLPKQDAVQLQSIQKQMGQLADAFKDQAKRTQNAARAFSAAEQKNDYSAMVENARMLQSGHSMLMSLENVFRGLVDTLSLIGGYINDATSRQSIQAIMNNIQNDIIPSLNSMIMAQQEVLSFAQKRLKEAAMPSSDVAAYEKKAWQLIQAKNPTFGVTIEDVKGAVAKDRAAQNMQNAQKSLRGNK